MHKEYIYKPKVGLIIVVGLVIGGVIFFLANEAMTLEGQAKFRRGFTLSEENGRIFFWVLAGLLAYVLLLCIKAVASGFGRDRKVVLTDKELLTPKSISSSRILRIPLHEVAHVQVSKAGSKEILVISYREGKVQIPQSVFLNEHLFSAFKYELLDNIKKLNAS